MGPVGPMTSAWDDGPWHPTIAAGNGVTAVVVPDQGNSFSFWTMA
jgi:hypothetical protein